MLALNKRLIQRENDNRYHHRPLLELLVSWTHAPATLVKWHRGKVEDGEDQICIRLFVE